MIKKTAFLIGFVSLLLGLPAPGRALTYVDLIGEFCDITQQVARFGQSHYNVYPAQYCSLKDNMEDAVMKRVAEQLNVKSFFGLLIDTDPIRTVVEGRDVDPEDLPEPVRKRYFDGQPANQALFYQLILDLYSQEQVYKMMEDSLKNEFLATEMWANGSLSDSPFDLIHDLNLIEVLIFGSQAALTDPNDVYKWPENQEDSRVAVPEGLGGVPDAEEEEPDGAGPSPSPRDTDGPATPAPLPEGCVPAISDSSIPNAADILFARAAADSAASSNLMCPAPAGLTFRPYDPPSADAPPTSNRAASRSDEGGGGSICPPGSRPRRPGEPPPAPAARAALRSDRRTPSPFIGGVLQPMGEDPRPSCPPPGMEIEVQAFGKAKKVCIDWVPCADYNDVRRFLREELGASEEAADAVEAAFCVEVVEATKPVSSFPENDGCIACHMEHMRDILEKVHEKNITPFANPMMASGTSNKFGPSFSFNATVFVKNAWDLLPPWGVTEAQDIREKWTNAQQDAERKLDPAEPRDTIPSKNLIEPSLTFQDVLAEIERIETNQERQLGQQLKNIRFAASAKGDQSYWSTIKPAIQVLTKSFNNINQRFTGLAETLQFKDKELCK